MISEFLEELEVCCKFGVKCTVNCQSFGVLGSEFVELADGCPVKMPLKNIQSHEGKCPYGKSTLHAEMLMAQNEELQEKILSLARKVGAMAVSIQRISSEAEQYKELYEEGRITPYYAYRYQIEDARHFARLLSFHMFDGSGIDKSRCFTSLQRLAAEWERRKYEFCLNDRENMHYLFYAATMCNFWTPKQQGRLVAWRDEFDPLVY